MNRIRTLLAVTAFVSLTGVDASAQDGAAPVIKDNSFLIEEAYNQEAGVIQWITTVQHYASPSRYWGLAYTTEIPLSGLRHQLSWTVPVESAGSGNGFKLTDLAFHYRCQVLDGANGVAVAPRISIVFPRGDNGEPVQQDLAIQLNLPVSIELSAGIVCHLNAGATVAPNSEVDFHFDEFPPAERDLYAYFAGGSIVWLVHPKFNALCEVLYSYSDDINEGREIVHFDETIVNPGIRIAIDKSFGQFVPGIGIPIRMSEGETDIGVFGYLSFEHSL